MIRTQDQISKERERERERKQNKEVLALMLIRK
jgi:hypothetical protein